MRVHFIAIGGSAMHNLALALHKKGYHVTGSDDEIFDPALTRLANCGLLPDQEGWHPQRITHELDAVIVGMHARLDNPELARARELKLKIYSYPEYLYEQSKAKTRVVIGGSHGKTSITAMIMHVLKTEKMDFDYMVGAQLEGFDVMVRLSDEAPVMIFEGDEYLTSPLDRRPKFHLYRPHIALLSGVAWDHINVFPTWENYIDQFRIFINLIEPQGYLTYCSEDPTLCTLAEESSIKSDGYGLPAHRIENGITILETPYGDIPLQIFGHHNLLNLNGARMICRQLNISDKSFYHAIASFGGAAKRLETIASGDDTRVFKDFAHSPSKLKATTAAVKAQYPNRRLIACMELHTFSSLSKEFLSHYRGAMNEATTAIVYFNPHTIALKKLPPITTQMVKEAFGRDDLMVFNDSRALHQYLLNQTYSQTNLLLMSSGNFDGIDQQTLAQQVIQQV